MQSKNILVALSGGVDSSVSALLLKEAGYTVSAVYMRTWMDETGSGIFGDCPWEEDLASARSAAKALGIELEVLNMIDIYKAHVVDYLVKGYQSGITPNPDIMCNREVKFGALLDYALKSGFDALATGHYAVQSLDAKGKAHIYEGKDTAKDQSYFLAYTRQEKLQKVLFPIGNLTKPEVREHAKRAELPNAARKDSQGICFLGKVPINDFLKQYIPENPGPIVNHKGDTLGTHRGLHHYTLGQRKGIGVPSNTDHEHYVVTAKDPVSNTLYIAFDTPEAEGLFTNTVYVQEISYIGSPITQETDLLAKSRYRDPKTPIRFIPGANNTAIIHFEEPQRALAPGQVLAFYKGSELLGGATYQAAQTD